MRRTLEKLAAGQPTTIVALGDSNTEVTFHTQGRMNWVGLLAEGLFHRYGANVARLINSGRCGGNVGNALDRLDRDVLRFQPDMVIIALGMNDACLGEEGLCTFRDGLRRLVRHLRETTGADLLLRTSNPIVPVHGLPLPEGVRRPGIPWDPPGRPLAAYSSATTDVAAELDCDAVDHYALWCGYRPPVRHGVADPNRLWPRMSDAIHPGWLGHLVFYHELAPWFDAPARLPWEA